MNLVCLKFFLFLRTPEYEMPNHGRPPVGLSAGQNIKQVEEKQNLFFNALKIGRNSIDRGGRIAGMRWT